MLFLPFHRGSINQSIWQSNLLDFCPVENVAENSQKALWQRRQTTYPAQHANANNVTHTMVAAAHHLPLAAFGSISSPTKLIATKFKEYTSYELDNKLARSWRERWGFRGGVRSDVAVYYIHSCVELRVILNAIYFSRNLRIVTVQNIIDR